jgi:predicted phosphodiesterase
MKVLALGDTHGNTTWKKILESEKDWDKVVFIGDYWDTHEQISYQEQRANFVEIMEFALKDPNVITLCGNHDLHYWLPQAAYSGYQAEYTDFIYELLYKYWHQLTAAVEFDRVLYTHAGVTENWQDQFLAYTPEAINKLLDERPGAFDFLPSDILRPTFRLPNPYGDNVWQGPMWVRPMSLKQRPGSIQRDDIYTPKQVVGHTHSNKIIIDGNFAFIDALPFEYLIVQDGEFINKKV